MRDLGIATSQYALMLSVLLGSAFLSRQFWGWLSDRVGGLWTILAGSSCQALALAGFGSNARRNRPLHGSGRFWPRIQRNHPSQCGRPTRTITRSRSELACPSLVLRESVRNGFRRLVRRIYLRSPVFLRPRFPSRRGLQCRKHSCNRIAHFPTNPMLMEVSAELMGRGVCPSPHLARHHGCARALQTQAEQLNLPYAHARGEETARLGLPGR
jgi:hypothetical protein